jgi:hypothetical protein
MTVFRSFFCLAIVVCSFSSVAAGQNSAMDMSGHQHSMNGMSGMQHDAASLIDVIQLHAGSGTDAEAASTPSAMWMTTRAKWSLMLHGEAFLNEIQQSGARGGDKFFSTNWLMGMAQRKTSAGTLTLRTMLSLEPATVSHRRYPELFQQGETAFGRPLVDGQHPHDLFMEIAALYDYPIGEHALLSFYGAPIGDPALGPAAYPHRASASENPVAPLGHHFQDSTHIAASVLTAGLTYRSVRIEASGFHGREPDENRWNIDSGKLDSWSSRITVNPARNWSLQYSIAGLASPEALAPREDVRRMTASVSYNRPLPRGNWASTVSWGRNSALNEHNIGNSFLLESTLRLADRNLMWTRIENVDRTNELLLGDAPEPPGFEEAYIVRVQAYTAGYAREFGNLRHLSTALGGQLTWYGVPPVLQPAYGTRPVGALIFLRLRLR